MTVRKYVRFGGIAGICAATALLAALLGPRVLAGDDDREGDESRVRRGFEIAPVPLTLAHKNRALVGLGSYIVNAVGDCDGCHSAGPQTQFLAGGNPYFGQPELINPATYLGGGRDFGPYVNLPHLYSRNLTPDHTGRPVGGDTFEQFRETIRTGHDPDQLHLNLAPPFDGTLLQIMPWPAYRNMTDRDLRAIYEYLSTIPCIAGPDHVC
jgi:hypothetical protein